MIHSSREDQRPTRLAHISISLLRSMQAGQSALFQQAALRQLLHLISRVGWRERVQNGSSIRTCWRVCPPMRFFNCIIDARGAVSHRARTREEGKRAHSIRYSGWNKIHTMPLADLKSSCFFFIYPQRLWFYEFFSVVAAVRTGVSASCCGALADIN